MNSNQKKTLSTTIDHIGAAMVDTHGLHIDLDMLRQASKDTDNFQYCYQIPLRTLGIFYDIATGGIWVEFDKGLIMKTLSDHRGNDIVCVARMDRHSTYMSEQEIADATADAVALHHANQAFSDAVCAYFRKYPGVRYRDALMAVRYRMSAANPTISPTKAVHHGLYVDRLMLRRASEETIDLGDDDPGYVEITYFAETGEVRAIRYEDEPWDDKRGLEPCNSPLIKVGRYRRHMSEQEIIDAIAARTEEYRKEWESGETVYADDSDPWPGGPYHKSTLAAIERAAGAYTRQNPGASSYDAIRRIKDAMFDPVMPTLSYYDSVGTIQERITSKEYSDTICTHGLPFNLRMLRWVSMATTDFTGSDEHAIAIFYNTETGETWAVEDRKYDEYSRYPGNAVLMDAIVCTRDVRGHKTPQEIVDAIADIVQDKRMQESLDWIEAEYVRRHPEAYGPDRGIVESAIQRYIDERPELQQADEGDLFAEPFGGYSFRLAYDILNKYVQEHPGTPYCDAFEMIFMRAVGE